MKLTRKDLDSSLIEKLDQLDGVITSYDRNFPDGYVSYGPNGFYFKKTNDTFLRKVYDESEIVDLENSEYSESSYILSSSLIDMRADEKLNSAAKSFLHNIKNSTVVLNERICFKKVLKSFLAVISFNGILHLYGNVNKDFNLIDILNKTFNLTGKIGPDDFVDIDEYDGTTLLISTENFGIYKLNISNGDIELILSLQNIRHCRSLANKNILVCSNEICGQFTIEGKCVEKYNLISNKNQTPYLVLNNDTQFIIYGAPNGITNLNKNLHIWNLDSAGIGYNCKDTFVEKNPTDVRYNVKFLKEDDSNIYLIGLFLNKIFIWKYSKRDFSLNESFIDCIKFENITDCILLNEKILFLIEDKIYVIKNNEIKEILKLESDGKSMVLYNNEILLELKDKIVKILVPEYESRNDILSYNIYNATEACNNIDICVKGATRSERISLFDAETGKEINPSFYMLYGTTSIIKLMNCSSKKILMKISVMSTSNLKAIIVKRNRSFLR